MVESAVNAPEESLLRPESAAPAYPTSVDDVTDQLQLLSLTPSPPLLLLPSPSSSSPHGGEELENHPADSGAGSNSSSSSSGGSAAGSTAGGGDDGIHSLSVSTSSNMETVTVLEVTGGELSEGGADGVAATNVAATNVAATGREDSVSRAIQRQPSPSRTSVEAMYKRLPRFYRGWGIARPIFFQLKNCQLSIDDEI